jgi:ferric-dicitrate binding protein FerR (iron transport regulator)
MSGKVNDLVPSAAPTIEEEASETFVQRLHGEWTRADQAAFEARLESDPAYADAYRRVDQSWSALDTHAESPEVMSYREEAIAYARKAGAGRWLKVGAYTRNRRRFAAAAAGIAFALSVVWQLSPYGYTPGQYRTGIGEQRIVELEDHSRITLDAATRLKVHYSNDVRVVQLQEGQAQFSVAKDPARPFKVVAGNRTIIAVGTVFTVEYVDQKVHVAMMEGKVAVVPQPSPDFRPPSASVSPSDGKGQGVRLGKRVARSETTLLPHTGEGARSADEGSTLSPSEGEGQGVRLAHSESLKTGQEGTHDQEGTIELIAGEELHVSRDGKSVVTANADIEAATAWREGKVIIRSEALGDAAQRLNRYSRRQIQIDDPALATKLISGVFEAGDTQGFVSAVQRYLPVSVDDSDASTIKLRLR